MSNNEDKTTAEMLKKNSFSQIWCSRPGINKYGQQY